jgi:hypothetical protein
MTDCTQPTVAVGGPQPAEAPTSWMMPRHATDPAQTAPDFSAPATPTGPYAAPSFGAPASGQPSPPAYRGSAAEYAYPEPGAPVYPPIADGRAHQPGPATYPPPGLQPRTPQLPIASGGVELVGKGLLFALGGVLLGGGLTVILWKFGIQWSFTSFVLAAASVSLYRAGSGGVLKQGAVPVIGLILAGTVASFFACVAVDLYHYWGTEDVGDSPWTFITDNILRPQVLGLYGRDIAFFVGFAALGMFSTLRRVVRARA